MARQGGGMPPGTSSTAAHPLPLPHVTAKCLWFPCASEEKAEPWMRQAVSLQGCHVHQQDAGMQAHAGLRSWQSSHRLELNSARLAGDFGELFRFVEGFPQPPWPRSPPSVTAAKPRGPGCLQAAAKPDAGAVQRSSCP